MKKARDLRFDIDAEKPRQGVRFRAGRNPGRTRFATAHHVRRNRRLKLRLASGKTLPGQYFDAETGLHYNYKRDYDPTTGRYIQSDPIGIFGGVNTYLYGNANPISAKDIFGLQAVPVPSPIPLPIIPQVIPGTPENDAFVDSILDLIDEITQSFGPTDKDDGGERENFFECSARCDAAYEQARRSCAELFKKGLLSDIELVECAIGAGKVFSECIENCWSKCGSGP